MDYVDDILIPDNNLTIMLKLASALNSSFALKGLGSTSSLEFKHFGTIGLYVTHSKYIIDLLKDGWS